MRHHLILLLTVLSGLWWSAGAAADEIGIPSVVPYAKVGVDFPKVQRECQLGEKVSSFLLKYSSEAQQSDDPGTGKYVTMEITELHAPSGGSWSGPKWMEVTGTLQEDGEAVASFRAKRFSTGGAFSGFKGTCSIIGRCARAIAKDIARWLANPYDGAELGDAQ